MKKRSHQLIVSLCVAVVLSSVASHVAIRCLGITSGHTGYRYFGMENQKPLTVLHGSSLAYDGLNWSKISDAWGEAIESWATPGSSPAEWEVEHRLSPFATNAFVVVSAYDLNEHWLCDFRADIVPLSKAISDLWSCEADWQFAKGCISQYPLMCLRNVFPTAGRSDGVMAGLRDQLSRLVQRGATIEPDDTPRFGSNTESVFKDKVTDWSPSRLQRRLALWHSLCQGKIWHSGPKKMALIRLLQQAGSGKIVLVVMPVSSIYKREFMAPTGENEFELELADIILRCPRAKVIRLDGLSVFGDNNLFRDFVHLNYYGQQAATAALLDQLSYTASPV
jgi:hypothetical protein